jgi:hypothetical protein
VRETLVLKSALVLVGVGVAIGVAAARVGTTVVESLLFGLSPTDPVTFVLAAVGMMSIACAAALANLAVRTLEGPLIFCLREALTRAHSNQRRSLSSMPGSVPV